MGTRSQLVINVANETDIEFIARGFSAIKPLGSIAETQPSISPDFLNSVLKSGSNPIYQLWQFAVATLNLRRVGFIQTMNFDLIREPLLHQESLGVYRLAPGLRGFSEPFRLINAIYVSENERKGGIGRALVQSQQERYREPLKLLYSKYNNDYFEFYRSLGFVEDTTTTSYHLHEKDIYFLVKNFNCLP